MSERIILQPTAEEMLKFYQMANSNPNMVVEIKQVISVKTLEPFIEKKEVKDILKCSERAIFKLIKEKYLNVASKKGNKNLFSREEVLKLKESNII